MARVTPTGDRRSKSEVAYDAIKESIDTREFTPGYRLVLSGLARDLGMSVVPVREAIRQLEAEGLVTFERNVGAQVAMVDASDYQQSSRYSVCSRVRQRPSRPADSPRKTSTWRARSTSR